MEPAAVGNLVLYSLTARNQAALKKTLNKSIDKCETNEFIKLFVAYTCYPADSLHADKNMPDNPILSEQDAEMLSNVDLENIAHQYLINNDHLYLESIRKTRKDENGVTIVWFEKGDNKYPKKEGESNLSYLHRLSHQRKRTR